MNPFSGPVDTHRRDIRHRIPFTLFSYMETADLCAAMAVNRYWARFLDREGPGKCFWKALTDPPPRLIRTVAQQCTITSLDISIRDVKHLEAICAVLPPILPTLVELSLYFYSRDARFLPYNLLWQVLKKPAPELQLLCLKGDHLFRHSDACGMPAGPVLLGGDPGKLLSVVLGGFRPVMRDTKGYPVTAFGKVETLDIAADSLSEVVTTRSQYPAVREITIHGVDETTPSLSLPRSARKVQVNFSAAVTSSAAEQWLRNSALERVDDVFATKGAGYLLGAVGGRDILGLVCATSGSIFRMETRVDIDCVRRALVAPEEVCDVLCRLVGLHKLNKVLCVHLEGISAHHILPWAPLEHMPSLNLLSLGASLEDIRAHGDSGSLIDLFADDTLIGLPRLTGVKELILVGEKGFGVEVEKKHVVQFIEQVTPAFKTLHLIEVSAVGDL